MFEVHLAELFPKTKLKSLTYNQRPKITITVRCSPLAAYTQNKRRLVMNIEALAGLTTTELSFYFLGGAALIITPPVVAVSFLWVLFRNRPDNTRSAVGRLLGGLGMGMSIAFALGATGVALLEPASPDLFLALLILCGVFAMLGAGKLYWTDE